LSRWRRSFTPATASSGVRRNEASMNFEYLIVGLIAIVVGVYLAMALLWPDRF
jgi:hypothetical protein